jgi:hypothetical protein
MLLRRLARLFVVFLVWLVVVAFPLYVVIYYGIGWWPSYPSAVFVLVALYWLRASGKNQTEGSGPNGRDLRPTINPGGSIRLIVSTRVRVYYGLTELLFGLAVFIYTFQKGRGDFSGDFSGDFATFNITLVGVTAFSAAYIMIRGLENMETGLRIEGCDLRITKR